MFGLVVIEVMPSEHLSNINEMSGSFHFLFFVFVSCHFQAKYGFFIQKIGQPIFSFPVILTKKRKMKNGMN